MRLSYRLLAVLLFVSPISWSKPVMVDKAIAVVNNDIITQTDYDQLLNTVQRNSRENNKPLPDAKTLRDQLIKKLVDDRLVLQQAERSGIEINDAQLDQTIENIIKESGKSREQFIKDLKSDDNLTYEQFREQVRQQLLISQTTQAAVRRQIHIDKQTINSLVNRIDTQAAKNIRYHVGHIMVKFSDDMTEEQTKAQAHALFKKLKDGADFAKLAKAQSQGPKAQQGGDWGWLTHDSMPTIFAHEIDQQKKGSLIGPFHSDAGFHILKILDVKGLQKTQSQEDKVRHILIKTSIITSDKKARSILAGIRNDILSGKGTFEEYARKYSQDPGSAVRGGDMGWSDPSVYVPEFREKIKDLPVGKLSQPFHTQYGWHIVEVEGRRTKDSTDETKKQKAFEILYQRQFQEQSQNWIDRLRQQSYIEVKPMS